MWHTFKHFIHMQYFLLPTNLVIIFVHWVSTVVCCTNPDNVHCFGTIFPNLNFVFASICAARPVHIQSDHCVVPQNYDVCPLLMMHKTCSINHGHLADLQKTLPTTDLNNNNKKKTFHLIKYLLATFIFFLSFQSVLVFILHYVLIVAFWIFTYYKIWILLNIYCFIWNYWIIYFVTCLEVFKSVMS